MSFLLTSLFWLASLLVVYPYLIYPPLLRVLATLRPRSANRRTIDTENEAEPSVTMVISAYNEESTIARKLSNTLALDYPSDRLQVIVVSDASSDLTDKIVLDMSAADERVQLVRQEQRRGKSAGLNKAIAAATGDIVVFSDANSMYDPAAIQQLVRVFADSSVGYAVGAALYHNAPGKRAAESEGFYWKLEMYLKRYESDYFSVVGGDGAIYAIRRQLYWNLADDDINDFVNPLQIVIAGYHGIFRPSAKCYEYAGETFRKEFKRKRRIVNRTWRSVWRYRSGLTFRNHSRFLFMLLSHKVIRWYALPFIVIAWTANTALLNTGGIYMMTWSVITISAIVALLGAILDGRGIYQPRVISVLYYFYSINLAGILGIWDEWRGVRHVTWDHIRDSKT